MTGSSWILKRVDLLPHSSFTHVERDVGLRGEKLLEYARGVVARIAEIGEPDYHPTLHLDVYGTLGGLFNNQVEPIVAYLGELKQAVGTYDLMIEAPVIMETREAQIDIYRALCAALARVGCPTQVIVDEWCNTLDDVRAFSDAGAGRLLWVRAIQHACRRVPRCCPDASPRCGARTRGPAGCRG